MCPAQYFGEINATQADPAYDCEMFDDVSTDSDESFSDHEAEESDDDEAEHVETGGARQRGAMFDHIKSFA